MPQACLDWSSPDHWSPQQRPCVHCGAPTNIRDGGRRPAHKTCAERAVDRIRAERATGHRRPALFPVPDDRQAAS